MGKLCESGAIVVSLLWHTGTVSVSRKSVSISPVDPVCPGLFTPRHTNDRRHALNLVAALTPYHADPSALGENAVPFDDG